MLHLHILNIKNPVYDPYINRGEYIMAISVKKDTRLHTSDPDTIYLSLFPANGQLETTEQIRRFELLRLAFFVLKLRKLEKGGNFMQAREVDSEGQQQEREREFKRSLLCHAIFQQVLTLISLDARSQAIQIIEACQN
jgi:hypothetical protein